MVLDVLARLSAPTVDGFGGGGGPAAGWYGVPGFLGSYIINSPRACGLFLLDKPREILKMKKISK